MAYPTTAALVAASTVAELTGLTTAQQDAYRAVAIVNVERFTGQKFEPRVGTLVLDGQGGVELYPPERVEVLTLIVVAGTSIDLTDVKLSPKGDRIYFLPLSGDYAVVAMREHAFDTRTFRSGAGTVTLTGTFGWTVCPSAVVEALRIEMEDLAVADKSQLAGIVASSRRLGIRDVAQGNLRLTVGQPGQISARAAQLLGDLIWLGPGGVLL